MSNVVQFKTTTKQQPKQELQQEPQQRITCISQLTKKQVACLNEEISNTINSALHNFVMDNYDLKNISMDITCEIALQQAINSIRTLWSVISEDFDIDPVLRKCATQIDKTAAKYNIG